MLERILAIIGAGILFLWLLGTINAAEFRLYFGTRAGFRTFCTEKA